MIEIIKVQRPVATSEAKAPCLIYTENKEFHFYADFSDEEIEHIFGNSYKVYWQADITPPSVDFIEPLENQGW